MPGKVGGGNINGGVGVLGVCMGGGNWYQWREWGCCVCVGGGMSGGGGQG